MPRRENGAQRKMRRDAKAEKKAKAAAKAKMLDDYKMKDGLEEKVCASVCACDTARVRPCLGEQTCALSLRNGWPLVMARVVLARCILGSSESVFKRGQSCDDIARRTDPRACTLCKGSSSCCNLIRRSHVKHTPHGHTNAKRVSFATPWTTSHNHTL